MKKVLLTTTTFSMIALSFLVSLDAQASTRCSTYGAVTTCSGDVNVRSSTYGGVTTYSGDLNGSSSTYGGVTTYNLR